MKTIRLLLLAALAGSPAQGYAADPDIASGGPKGLGQNAQGVDPTGLEAAPASTVPKMPGSEKLLDAGRALEGGDPMAEQLKSLPKFPDQLGSRVAGVSRGGQTGKLVETEGTVAGDGSVRILLKLREDGTSEVLGVQALVGKSPAKPDGVRGSFVVEIARGETTLAVQTMEDPFELRGLTDPKAPGEGHSLSRATEAIITVEVPDGKPEGVSVRLLRFKHGTPLPEHLDVQKYKSLQPSFDTLVRVPADKLGPMLQQRISLQQNLRVGVNVGP